MMLNKFGPPELAWVSTPDLAEWFLAAADADGRRAVIDDLISQTEENMIFGMFEGV